MMRFLQDFDDFYFEFQCLFGQWVIEVENCVIIIDCLQDIGKVVVIGGSEIDQVIDVIVFIYGGVFFQCGM